MKKETTREGWLVAAVKLIEAEVFKPRKVKMPAKWAVSCGFPYGHNKAIGQCFDPVCTPDGVTEMFVCPTQHDVIRVLDILTHEMVHAIVGCECGHKGDFKRLAREVGLSGKLTATIAEPGTELHDKLTEISKQLGDYPHKGMIKRKKSKRGAMGGWLRLVSINDEGYKVLISPRQLEDNGAPMDPWGDEMVQVEKEG